MSEYPTSPRARLHNLPSALPRSMHEPDPGVSEGVCAIIYAAPRTELKGELTSARDTDCHLSVIAELHVLRDILMHKYGREFSIAVMENRDGCVSERVRGPLLRPCNLR